MNLRIRAQEPPPPPGRLVSLDTHRLHLPGAGHGTPPVVFDAALGGSSLSWTYVQPAVAAFTTACTYDRAGFGWSDAGPLPRTAGRIADELHTLLTTAAIAPPFVLVGHSFGASRFAPTRPGIRTTLPGLVFVDPAHPEEWRDPSPADRERLQRGVTLCRRGVFAAKSGIAALVARLASAGALDLARGIAAAVSRRTLHRQDEEILAPVTKLPMEVRAVLRWMWTQPRYFEALGSQIAHVCASAAELDLRAGLRRPAADHDLGVRDQRGRQILQDALARRSTRGRHIAAEKSGHWIPLDEPATIVAAIQDVVTAVRSSTATPKAAEDQS